MTEKEFLDIMDEILDTEESVAMDTVLDDLEEWDSLSYVMFQAQMLEREEDGAERCEGGEDG